MLKGRHFSSSHACCHGAKSLFLPAKHFTQMYVLACVLLLLQEASAHAHAEFHQSTAALSPVPESTMSGVLEGEIAAVYPHYASSDSLMRRGGFDVARLWKLAILTALLGSLAAVCFPAQKQMQWKAKEAGPAIQENMGLQCYPWLMLPSPAELTAAGPTFSDGVGAGLKKVLLARGMRLRRRGYVLLATDMDGSQESKALIVHRLQAGPKWALAAQLNRIGLQDLAPLTLRKPSELSKLLQLSLSKQRMMTEAEMGPWLLKHTLARGDADGATSFKDARSLLAFWESLPKSTRCSYVAQACLRHPLTLESGHVKVHAFVLALDNGRWFLHTEHLLSIVQPPDLSIKDSQAPEGRSVVRGTGWSHHKEVWQRLCHSLAIVARHKSLGQKWLPPQTSALPGQAGPFSFQLFVAEFAIDWDKQPWLLDMYPMSENQSNEGSVAENVWEEVTKDTCNLILNPLAEHLQRGCRHKVIADSTGGDAATGLETSRFIQICEPGC